MAATDAELRDLLDRWDTFLAKVEARFAEAKQQAIDAATEQLVASDYDVQATLTTVVGIEGQLRGLTDKIDETWDRGLDRRIEALTDWDTYQAADQKGDVLSSRLRAETRHLRTTIDGRVAELFWAHALPLLLDADFYCSQCGGSLEPRRDTFKSHYVTCPSCQTVNTYLPDAKVSQLEWYGADLIAAYRVLPEKGVVEARAEAFRVLRSDGDLVQRQRHFAAWELADRQYWTRFYEERVRLWPAYAKTRDADIERKLAIFASQTSHLRPPP